MKNSENNRKYLERKILIDTASYQACESSAIRYRIIRSGDTQRRAQAEYFRGTGERRRCISGLGVGRARGIGKRRRRRRPGRGAGRTAGSDQGWILSAFQGSPRTSERDARNLAGWPRHRDRAASRSQWRVGGRETARIIQIIFGTRQLPGHGN